MLIQQFITKFNLSVLGTMFHHLSDQTDLGQIEKFQLVSTDLLNGIKIKGSPSSRFYVFQFSKSLSQVELHKTILELTCRIETHLISRKFKNVKPMISHWGRVLLGHSKLLILAFNISIQIPDTVFFHGRFIPESITRTKSVESTLVAILKNSESFTLLSLLKVSKRSSVQRKKVSYACSKYVMNRVFIFPEGGINIDKLITLSKKYFKTVGEYTSFILYNKRLVSLPESIYINLLKEDIQYLLSKIPKSRFENLGFVKKPKESENVEKPEKKDLQILPFTHIDWHLTLDKRMLEAGSASTYNEADYVETYPKGKERIFDICGRRKRHDKINYSEDTINEEKASSFDAPTYVLRYNYNYGMSSDQVRIFFQIRQLVRYGLKVMSLHDSNSNEYMQANLIVKDNIEKFYETIKIVQLQRGATTLDQLKRYCVLRENALTNFSLDFWRVEKIDPPYLYILELCNMNEYRKKMSVEELRLSGLIGCDEGDIIYFYYIELMSRLCYEYPEIILNNGKRSTQVGLSGLKLPEHESLLCSLVHRGDCLPPRSTTYKRNFGRWEMMVREKYKNSYLPGVTLVCIRSGVYF